jgi:hypothetical protein
MVSVAAATVRPSMLARSLVHHVLAGAAAADVTALIVVDVVSWRRTRPLRTGHLPPSAASVASSRPAGSSPTTFLAGGAGWLTMAYGLTAGPGDGWASPACILAGALIGVTGLAGRVRMVEAGEHGLAIHYAAHPPWRAPWTQISGLEAPSTPLGGWRLVVDGGSRTLMASDLLSNEWLLVAVIQAAGLSFTGTRWEGRGTEARLGISRPA